MSDSSRPPGSADPARATRPAPPTPVVLPPTDPATFVPPPELGDIAAAYERGDYRAAVDPIERLYFACRNTLHQGLLQYTVALVQLRGSGLVQTPRRLLRQALELLAPYPEWQEGFDLAAVRRHGEALLGSLPEGVHHASAEEIAGWWLEPPPPVAP